LAALMVKTISDEAEFRIGTRSARRTANLTRINRPVPVNEGRRHSAWLGQVIAPNTLRFFPTIQSERRPIAVITVAQQNFVMTQTISNHVTPDDKLHVLRQRDQRRKWKSLDDRRFCSCCKTVFNGREVEITGGTRPLGPLRLICPTENCPSVPADWVYPDESLKDQPCRQDAAARAAA